MKKVENIIASGNLQYTRDITEEVLRETGLVRGGKDGVRLLGKGEIKAKAMFIVTGATKGAIAAVEKAGGSVEVAAPAKKADAE